MTTSDPGAAVQWADPPPDVVTLAALADPSTFRSLVAQDRAVRGVSRRRAVLGLLHPVLAVLGDAVLGPLVRDGAVVAPHPASLGVRFGAAPLQRAWSGGVAVRVTGFDATGAGAVLGALLRPLLAPADAERGLRPGVLRRVAAESVRACGERHGRWAAQATPPPVAPPAGWIGDVLVGAGLPVPPAGALRVQVDGGPALSLPLPGVCCVLAGTARTGESCPTCPLFADDGVRRREAQTWLAGIGDAEFAHVVGRARAL